jgi:hypothetical protein|eukprot:COSAG06_NODE_25_length_32611_cov_10.451160_3_plen_933_part_00
MMAKQNEGAASASAGAVAPAAETTAASGTVNAVAQKFSEMDAGQAAPAGQPPRPAGGAPWGGQYGGGPPPQQGANFTQQPTPGNGPTSAAEFAEYKRGPADPAAGSSRMPFATAKEPWEMPEVGAAVGEGGIFGPVDPDPEPWSGAQPVPENWTPEQAAAHEVAARAAGVADEGQYYESWPAAGHAPANSAPVAAGWKPPTNGLAPLGDANNFGASFPAGGGPQPFVPGSAPAEFGYPAPRPGNVEGFVPAAAGDAVGDATKTPWANPALPRAQGSADGQMGMGEAGDKAADPAYRTKLCAHWHAGKCQYGDRCIFAHGVTELRSFGDPDMVEPGGAPPPLDDTGVPASENPAYRTQICTRWMEGSCQYGDRCNFAHGEEQLRQFGGTPTGVARGGFAAIDVKSRSNDPAYRTKLCTRWAQGACQYGDRCMFAHGEEQLRAFGGVDATQAPRRAPTAAENSDPAFRTKLCTRWLQGSCQYGDRCNFAHGEEQLRTYGSPVPAGGRPVTDPASWGQYPPMPQLNLGTGPEAGVPVDVANRAIPPRAAGELAPTSIPAAAKENGEAQPWLANRSSSEGGSSGDAVQPTTVRAVICKMQHSPSYENVVQVIGQYFVQYGVIESITEVPLEERCKTTFSAYHCSIHFGDAAAAHAVLMKPRHQVAGHLIVLLSEEDASPTRAPLSIEQVATDVPPNEPVVPAVSDATVVVAGAAPSVFVATVPLQPSDAATNLEFRPPGYSGPDNIQWTASLQIPGGTFKEPAGTAQACVLATARKPLEGTITCASHIVEIGPASLVLEKVTLSLPVERKFPSADGLQIFWLKASSETEDWKPLPTTMHDNIASAVVEGFGDFVVTATQDAVTKADAADVTRWLTGFGMESFAEALITDGISNLALLRSLEERDVNEIMDEQGMQRMQKRVFKREWFKLKDGPPLG